MELGTYRLAEINKGGGLRQKAAGQATQYLNGVGAWVDMPTAMTPTAHSHDIPDLYCGVPNIVAGRILISGSGASSNPTWLEAGTNGKILGWTSDAPAWVDAPSGGSTVSPADPTASVGLAAVNGSATTFMRSDAAPKLDVSIAPTWTGTHTFNGYCEFNGGTNIPTGRVRNFLNLSSGTELTPDAGTDLLIFFERPDATIQTLILPTTNMASRAGDIIRVVLCGNCNLTFSTGSSNNRLIKPAYYGATANYELTTQGVTGDWMFICDGTYWRSYMLPQLYE